MSRIKLLKVATPLTAATDVVLPLGERAGPAGHSDRHSRGIRRHDVAGRIFDRNVEDRCSKPGRRFPSWASA